VDTRVVEIGAVGLCRAIVLAEDVLEHVNSQSTRLIAGVVADAGAVIVLVIVIVLKVVIEVVVRVPRAVGVVVKASHATSIQVLERYNGYVFILRPGLPSLQ